MAIDHLIETKSLNKTAPVYFADDDNNYDFRLFQNFAQIKPDKAIGVLPVGGGTGGINIEGPKCENHKVVDWFTRYAPTRLYAGDMAGFAIRAEIFVNPKVRFIGNQKGMLETEIFGILLEKI